MAYFFIELCQIGQILFELSGGFVLTGTGNLIELARFSSLAEFDLSGFLRTLTGANSRETEKCSRYRRIRVKR